MLYIAYGGSATECGRRAAEELKGHGIESLTNESLKSSTGETDSRFSYIETCEEAIRQCDLFLAVDPIDFDTSYQLGYAVGYCRGYDNYSLCMTSIDEHVILYNPTGVDISIGSEFIRHRVSNVYEDFYVMANQIKQLDSHNRIYIASRYRSYTVNRKINNQLIRCGLNTFLPEHIGIDAYGPLEKRVVSERCEEEIRKCDVMLVVYPFGNDVSFEIGYAVGYCHGRVSDNKKGASDTKPIVLYGCRKRDTLHSNDMIAPHIDYEVTDIATLAYRIKQWNV